jgi:hypothetical protein
VISVSSIKSYLGIAATTTTYDAFLKEQEAIVAESIQGYCGRLFNSAGYTQSYYLKDYEVGIKNLLTFHFPLINVTAAKEYDDEGNELRDVLSKLIISKPYGDIYLKDGFFNEGDKVTLTYTAGYATIPAPIRSVLYSLVEERYNKKINGVSLNFGSDVQRISIPGTISIDFDYSLQANERKTAFGTILGNYVNVLDSYRSERVVLGSGVVTYVG